MPDVIITSEGKAIDIEGLRLKNEKTVAVGNMRVNARGDELDPITGAVFRTRAERMKDHYKLNTVVPTNEPVTRSARAAKPAPAKPVITPTEAPQSKAFPSAPPVVEPAPEPTIEKVVDNSIDPNTWVDTPPAPTPVADAEPEVTIVGSRPVDGGIEIEYSDGSMEVIPAPAPTKSVRRL
jgi:hypothetical protein